MAMMGCRPRDVLSNSKMREVLYDLHRVDGALQTAGYVHGHDKEQAAYYQSVLDKHGVTQAQFDSSLVWFTDNPQIFNKIYPKVIDRLQADYDHEAALRDERMEKLKSSRKQRQGEEDQSSAAATQLRPIEEIQKEYLFGLENPWKKWEYKDFCEKNVIIFGQLEKK